MLETSEDSRVQRRVCDFNSIWPTVIISVILSCRGAKQLKSKSQQTLAYTVKSTLRQEAKLSLG